MSPEAIDARDKIIASEARAQALEEAAALADQEAAKAKRENFTPSWADASKTIAAAIRELKKGPANDPS